MVYQVEEEENDSGSTSNSIFDGYNLDIIVDYNDAEDYHFVSFRTSDNNEVKTFEVTSNQQNITYTFTEEEAAQLSYVNIGGAYLRQINKYPNIAWNSTHQLLKDLTTPTVDFSNIRYTNTPYDSWANFVSYDNISSSIKVLKLNDVNFEFTSNLSGYIYSSFYALTYIEELYLRNLPTSGITSMILLFLNCSNLKILDVTGWDISSVTSTTSMFNQCTSLTKLILGEVSQTTYDWWLARLTDANIQDNVTIDYTIV